MAKKKPLKKEPVYTITMEYPDGSVVTDEHVYKLENDVDIDFTTPIIITCHKPGTPKLWNLVDGMKITFTEENVEVS